MPHLIPYREYKIFIHNGLKLISLLRNLIGMFLATFSFIAQWSQCVKLNLITRVVQAWKWNYEKTWKRLKNSISKPENVIFESFYSLSIFHFIACATLLITEYLGLFQPIEGVKKSGPFNNYRPVKSEEDRIYGLYRSVYFAANMGACKNTVYPEKAYPVVCVKHSPRLWFLNGLQTPFGYSWIIIFLTILTITGFIIVVFVKCRKLSVNTNDRTTSTSTTSTSTL